MFQISNVIPLLCHTIQRAAAPELKLIESLSEMQMCSQNSSLVNIQRGADGSTVFSLTTFFNVQFKACMHAVCLWWLNSGTENFKDVV